MKKDDSRARVKIAVLDTGINKEDEVFDLLRTRITEDRRKQGGSLNNDPIQSIYNFIGGEDKDSYGHGTHVAGLLMKVAPQADLYVAKIAHGSLVENADHISNVSTTGIGHYSDSIVDNTFIGYSLGYQARCRHHHNVLRAL
jgi:subtilisin family serine protease